MPNYNYHCECGNEFEAFNRIADRATASCPSCRALAKQALSRRPAAAHDFKYGFFEHMSEKGEYARNRQELRELCRRHECYAPGVLD